MVEKLKKALYFPIASYFRFFAKLRLYNWQPRIIVVTGSNGKTTLLHLLESQIGESARFSHHANSAYGIPFDILDLHRKSLHPSEWIMLVLKAPLQVFAASPKEKIYVVEADCDRPGEGKFLASLLRPEVVLWVSVSRTHALNFDHLIDEKKFETVDEAIAYEYGYFLEYCQKLAVVNGDVPLQVKQIERTKADTSLVKKSHYLDSYSVNQAKTIYKIDGQTITFPALLPEEIFYSLVMCKKAAEYLRLSFDPDFKKFTLPPGRGSFFKGIKQTTLIDSTYNANLSSMVAVLHMFAKMPGDKKWVVLGDMMELGVKEQEEHERLAETLSEIKLKKIILVGGRTKKYTYQKLQSLVKDPEQIVAYDSAKDALEDLQKNLRGGETILFKGSQSLLLEGIIEQLLADKKDAALLPRRGSFWKNLRAKKGL